VKRAVLLGALVLAGCGAQAQETAPREPQLPRALARSWAQQADAVAAALEAGDGCTARMRAQALQERVIDAVNERRVPARFQEQLTSSVNDLAGRITCTPAPPTIVEEPEPDPPEKHKPHPPKKAHGHGKKEHKKK
jgi:hypothetical protein